MAREADLVLRQLMHGATFSNSMVSATMMISVLAAAAAIIVFAYTMVYAALTDLLTRKIRNSLVLLFLLAYAGLAPLAGFAASEIMWSVTVAFAVLLFAFALFALGLLGGGDAKLAAVSALWFGADHTPAYLIWAILLGGAFALAILLFRRLPLPVAVRSSSWVAQLHCRGTGMPFGVAMALAALVVFPATRWMNTALGV
jgi:prepilin peptidase CpaA